MIVFAVLCFGSSQTNDYPIISMAFLVYSAVCNHKLIAPNCARLNSLLFAGLQVKTKQINNIQIKYHLLS